MDSHQVFDLEDPNKAANLELLSWSLLEASLISVAEAFVANLGSDGVSASVRRTVRLLATVPEAELPALLPGLKRINGDTEVSYWGFVISPGIGESKEMTTAHLKLTLLRAFCTLGKMMCRLDPESVRAGQAKTS